MNGIFIGYIFLAACAGGPGFLERCQPQMTAEYGSVQDCATDVYRLAKEDRKYKALCLPKDAGK